METPVRRGSAPWTNALVLRTAWPHPPASKYRPGFTRPGDDALRTVAQLLREHTPPEAILCRAGGEEFLIALTTESFDVRALAHRLCQAIAELPTEVTASIGTTSALLHSLARPGGAHVVDELIGLADQGMYAAKRNGGNQTQHA